MHNFFFFPNLLWGLLGGEIVVQSKLWEEQMFPLVMKEIHLMAGC